jgi:protein involved in polysaccharide export with SLBB domain
MYAATIGSGLMKQTLFAVLALLMVSAAGAEAQAKRGWDMRGLQATRAELEAQVSELEATSSSSAYSGNLRSRARREAELIRKRLDEGDIRVGDRIMLRVEGHAFPESVSVVSARMVILPQVGEVPLTGVLRSELQEHMTTAIARFIRNPVVEARSLIRLQIRGAVRNPGFFTVPSDLLIEDAIMAAGGPDGRARTDRLRIERGGQVIWDGERLQGAMLNGRTLDQLSIQAGDDIVIPERRSGAINSLREGAMIIGSLVTLVALAERLGAF